MLIHNKVVIVTGGGRGIGEAMCRRFRREGAAAVVVVDRDGDQCRRVATGIDGIAVEADVSRDEAVRELVDATYHRFGRVDLFCSNAGIAFRGGLESIADADWQRIWDVNVMAHIYAARAVIPHMLEAGGGYLLQTASAAGLLSHIGSAPYAVTKHAAVALAEWLSITYGDRGIRVSCLCPQGVRTDMLRSAEGSSKALLDAGAISPEMVADAVVAGLEAERFLILPHPEVAEYFRRKATDYDRWLSGMRRLQAKVEGTATES